MYIYIYIFIPPPVKITGVTLGSEEIDCVSVPVSLSLQKRVAARRRMVKKQAGHRRQWVGSPYESSWLAQYALFSSTNPTAKRISGKRSATCSKKGVMM